MIFGSCYNLDQAVLAHPRLVTFIQQLSTGSLVACAARDDAMGNLSSAAKDALKICGATLIDSISYRGSYALIGPSDDLDCTTFGWKTLFEHRFVGTTVIASITLVFRGVKDGPALAEQAFPDGQVAVASAEYSAEVAQSYTSSTTTTTASAVASCAMFTCPSGSVIKQEQMWHLGSKNLLHGGKGWVKIENKFGQSQPAEARTLKSQNETVCCQAAAEDMADVGVRSAGYADGNEARHERSVNFFWYRSHAKENGFPHALFW